ncbi:hypothetical protein GCM10010341_81150 [Streptomyces noursei]|nr:hypothetical protein GCM10010341_81150 [Streptomyces noursei]
MHEADPAAQRFSSATQGYAHQARQRATLVLLAARGRPNARIAVQTRPHVDTVRTLRGGFAGEHLMGSGALNVDARESGREKKSTKRRDGPSGYPADRHGPEEAPALP